jgi:dihydrofolate reductase
MARLSFIGNVSLDGYINDADGNFDWTEPSDEVHKLFNDLDRSADTHLYGRRLYETMAVWETMPPTSAVMDEYAEVWRNSDKIVFSSTLPDVSSSRTTLVREFSPAYVAELKASSTRDLTIGGPNLAAQAMDLIDDLHILLVPVLVGGGTPFFTSGVTGQFTLAESRPFDTGAVYLHYRREI